MKRRLRPFLLFLLMGLVTTLAIAWLMGLVVDVQQGRQSQAENFIDDEHWTVTRWDKAGAAQITSLRERGMNIAWSPQQAAGAPNSPQLGDQHTAWASLGTSSPEWLVLDYANPVIPRRVDVYESYTPGALSQVSIFDAQGQEIVAWSGADPTPAGTTTGPTPVSKIPISLNVTTRRVKIYLASDKVPGWNEIDAVGLIDDQKHEQWATRVTASSTYASSYGSPRIPQGNPADLASGWSGLVEPTAALREGKVTREERRVDARGWPMLALYSSTDVAAAPSAVNTVESLDLVDELSASASPYGGGKMLRGTVALNTPTGAVPVPLPLHPIWVGLIGDTVLYAAAWFGLWATLVVPRRFVREVARLRRGGCVRCGYDLGFDFINGCPECGWRRDEQSAPPTSRSAVSQRMNGN